MPTTFDALAYFEKLKSAGVPEDQARVHANAFRDFSTMQEEKFQRQLAERENKWQKEAATKGDLRETELRLQKEIREVELRLLLWQWGIGLALVALMAKGFGWLGF